MSANFNYCLIGGGTDVGLVRKANEDRGSRFETPNGLVSIVCDGMGGHVGGQIASQIAIETIKDFLEKKYFENPGDAILDSILAANNAIITRAQLQPELTGMGSTCVMMIIRDGKVYYGHVGDSRLYIVINHIITQLTKDHSFVQLLVDEGRLTKENAEQHPRKNEITNALGLINMQTPTIASSPISPPAGATLLLCSDGLTGMVSDKYIERIVSNRTLSLDNRVNELIRLAKSNGGVDNITVELVEFALGTSDILAEPEKKQNLNKKVIVVPILLFLLLIIIGSAFLLLTPPGENTGKTEYTRIRKEINGDTILYKIGKTVTPNPQLETRFSKDSCFVLPEYNDNIKVTSNQDNIIEMVWTDKDFDKDRIIIRIETDSISYLVTFPIKHEANVYTKTPAITLPVQIPKKQAEKADKTQPSAPQKVKQEEKAGQKLPTEQEIKPDEKGVVEQGAT